MLKFLEQKSVSSQPKKLVFLLHGYGANGQNLMSVAHGLHHIFPDYHFISPDAPFAATFPGMENFAIPESYQWFSLESYEPEIICPKILKANKILDAFINEQLQRIGLSFSDVIMAGFSQGAMMAMYNSLRRPDKNSGVISFSGKLILPDFCGEEIRSKPEICLIHGKDDSVLPFANFLEAKEILEKYDFKFQPHALDNLDHSIDHRALEIAGKFLRN